MIEIIKTNKYPDMTRPKINVGIGDCKIASNPHILATYSLGSCVAIILYEPHAKIAALIHALLPEPKSSSDNPYKYVSSAIPKAVEELESRGIRKSMLVASVVGGASILKSTMSMLIGKRNIETAKSVLKTHGIKLVAEDTGGSHSRSVYFDVANGRLFVIIPKFKLFGG
ncbi:MAG: chemotaxis protein CheD [Staphylothermus sp.]|nr:chemotaxis protein CheD [Staphylothermus sp.]